MTEHNTQSKSMLAKLLATENISFQHSPSAKTAYFDVKNRLLVLPVWQNISNDLYDMLVVHEVGHALDTKADEWIGSIEKICKNVHGKENDRAKNAIKGFLNVVEDARIDKRQKRRYPGARRNYIVGYKELIQRDFFGTATKDINSMSFIDRMNLYFKGGALLGVKFSKDEMPFIKRAENLETWAEVEALTEDVYRFAKSKGEENRELESDLQTGQGDDEGDDDELFDFNDDDLADNTDGDGNTAGDEGDDENDEDGPKRKVKSEKSESSDDDDEEDEGETKSYSNGAGSSDNDFIPESETERAWERNMSNIVADDDVNYIYVDIPKPNHDVIVHDYKKVLAEIEGCVKGYSGYTNEWLNAVSEKMNQFKAEENATISFMVKEFEARKSADIYSRISTAKTGVIDTNKLHSYKYNDDIFRRLSVVPTGKNHGFIMFLDWSGSMHYNMTNTVKQLMSLTMFCKRVQIPFEVYTFRDPTFSDDRASNCFEHAPGTFLLGNLRMRNILSSRMNVTELNRAYTFLWTRSSWAHVDPMNGTPLNQAIIAAEKLVNDFRRKNKLQIVNTIFLTDGDSNPISGLNINNQHLGYKPKGNKFILRDNVAKKEYNIAGDIRQSYGELTNILLRILKDRTDSNLIGFFLSTDSTRSIMHRYFNYEVHDKMSKFWRENKFVPVKSQGYDEYYVINAKALGSTENKLSIDPSTMTKNKIAKEFMKFTENKSINRVLLRQFIDKVSSNKVKAA